jgi:hypothetical protein
MMKTPESNQMKIIDTLIGQIEKLAKRVNELNKEIEEWHSGQRYRGVGGGVFRFDDGGGPVRRVARKERG